MNQFETTNKQLKAIDIETLWETKKEEGITALILSHNGETKLTIGYRTKDVEYIKEITTECDIFTFAVILMNINENPYFDDKEVRVTEIGAFRY